MTKDARETAERLREQIRKVKKLTNMPFSVNILVPSGEQEKKFSDLCAEVVINEGVPVVITSQGRADVYTQKFKDAGIKVLHVVATPSHAHLAEQAGVDAVITSGTEGGGHSGFNQLATFALVPQVADAVKIPVIAGGGIADGRGLVAALSLGADGVYMGTRFIATQECPAHPNMKWAVVHASATDTTTIKHGAYEFEKALDVQTELRRGSLRLIQNEFATQALKLQAKGASPEEINEFLAAPSPGAEGVSRAMAASVYGNVADGDVAAGQEVGMINDILTCRELITRMIRQAEDVIKKFS